MAGQVLDEWAAEVAAAVGRSVEQVRNKGLGASDFPLDHDLRIELVDGSFVQFRYAFAVPSTAKRAIAVFTEHCGYHVFPEHEAVISKVART
jgi:hypothetical protein